MRSSAALASCGCNKNNYTGVKEATDVVAGSRSIREKGAAARHHFWKEKELAVNGAKIIVAIVFGSSLLAAAGRRPMLRIPLLSINRPILSPPPAAR